MNTNELDMIVVGQLIAFTNQARMSPQNLVMRPCMHGEEEKIHRNIPPRLFLLIIG